MIVLDYVSVVVVVQSMDGRWEGQGWLPWKDPCEGKGCSLVRAWVQVGKEVTRRFGCGDDLAIEFHFVHHTASGMLQQQLSKQFEEKQSLADGLMGWTELDRITFRPTEGGSNGKVKG